MSDSTKPTKPIIILLADDDPDDCEMTRKALEKNQIVNEFYTVGDGEELLDFLHRRGRHAPPAQAPRPTLILLDLNMPRKDGREALAELKKDASLRGIPVVIMTTSKREQDITRAYDLGGNSFISKPITLAALTAVTHALGQYWFQTVTLPEPHEPNS